MWRISYLAPPLPLPRAIVSECVRWKLPHQHFMSFGTLDVKRHPGGGLVLTAAPAQRPLLREAVVLALISVWSIFVRKPSMTSEGCICVAWLGLGVTDRDPRSGLESTPSHARYGCYDARCDGSFAQEVRLCTCIEDSESAQAPCQCGWSQQSRSATSLSVKQCQW